MEKKEYISEIFMGILILIAVGIDVILLIAK